MLGYYLVGPATHAVFGQVLPVELYLWGGINMALILSLLTFLAGWLVYRRHQSIRDRLAAFEARSPIDFDAGWDRLLDGFKAFAAWQTRLIQNGSLQRYMAVMFATFVVMVGGTYLLKGAFQGVPGLSADGVHPVQWTVLGLIVAGAILTVWTHSRMTAIAGMGAAGIGVSLIFIMFSAPDVAITQLLVEVLVVVLVSIVMLRLPYLPRRSKTRFRTGHAVIAGGTGLVTTFLLMSVMATDFDRRLTTFFEVTSYPEAHGRNIVNVILVDFRAMDTFGEIVVVAIAAIAAFALLRGAPRRKPEEES